MRPWVDRHPLLFVVLNISFVYVTVSIVISYIGGCASGTGVRRDSGQETNSDHQDLIAKCKDRFEKNLRQAFLFFRRVLQHRRIGE